MGEKASLSLLTVVAAPVAVTTAPLIVADHMRDKSAIYWGMPEYELLEKAGSPENIYLCNNGQFYIWEYSGGEMIEEDERFIFISNGAVRDTSQTFKYPTLCALETEQQPAIKK